MRKSSWVVLALVVVLAAGAVYLRASSRPKLSEEEQVQTFLSDGQEAIERKDLRGIMSCVSTEYSDAVGMTYDAIRLQAVEAIRTEGTYNVLLENPSIRIDGESAVIETRPTIYLVTGNGSQHRVFSQTLTLYLEKEDVKRFLVLPTKAWKVVRVDGLHDVFVE